MKDHGEAVLLGQGRRVLPIGCLKSVLHGLAQETMGGIPLTGGTVQRGHALRLGRVQLGSQEISKKMVIPIPITLIVEGHNKEVRPFQSSEQRRVPGWRHTKDRTSARGLT